MHFSFIMSITDLISILVVPSEESEVVIILEKFLKIIVLL